MPAMTDRNAPSGRVSVQLARHGLYGCCLTRLAQIDHMSKKKLAQAIADGHTDNYLEAYRTASYWMQFPKTILLCVYGDMFSNEEETTRIWNERMDAGITTDGIADPSFGKEG